MRRAKPEVVKGALSARRNFNVYEGAVEKFSPKNYIAPSIPAICFSCALAFRRIMTGPVALSRALWSWTLKVKRSRSCSGKRCNLPCCVFSGCYLSAVTYYGCVVIFG
jgi:hypothetical protein